MSNLENYAKNFRNIENAKRQRQEHPKGWEPGLNSAKKTITSEPQTKAVNPEDHKFDKYLVNHLKSELGIVTLLMVKKLFTTIKQKLFLRM